MICPRCHGTGMVRTSRDEKIVTPAVYEKPCPDCHGGVRHCCEGEDVDLADPEE